jgi:hypothetical protein
MSASDFKLSRNAFGRLVYAGSDGRTEEGVVPVRAFPLSAPGERVAVVGADGHELAWIDRLEDLPADVRALVEEELTSREVMPEIRRIVDVSSFATPSTWRIETDRGETSMVLKGEEDIRRLSRTSLLIADSNGIHFLIRDLATLDRASRKLLDRFL